MKPIETKMRETKGWALQVMLIISGFLLSFLCYNVVKQKSMHGLGRLHLYIFFVCVLSYLSPTLHTTWVARWHRICTCTVISALVPGAQARTQRRPRWKGFFFYIFLFYFCFCYTTQILVGGGIRSSGM